MNHSPPNRHRGTSVLPVVSASTLAGMDVPRRQWLADELVPDLTVTLLGGDGGTGKSLLALQLAVAVVSGTDWLKTMPEMGPALYLSAEDDIDELHRRLAAITSGIGVDLTDLADLRIVSLAGEDAVLAAPDVIKGTIKPRQIWRDIEIEVGTHRPRLVVFDTLADLFGGNENDRAQARQFVGLLRGLALKFQCAVVVLAHPSLTGLATGSGSSGSTGWSNSVRSRLYFERVKDNGEERDPDLRRLKLMKSNYGRIGQEVYVRWRDGMFRLDGGSGGFERAAAEAGADETFLALLSQFEAEGRSVTDKPGPSWAPKMFGDHPKNEGMTRKGFADAMNRLLGAGRIVVVESGPPSKRRSRLEIKRGSE